MSGIFVGADGSRHSQRALEWAMRESAVHHTPLTVVTVYQSNPGSWGSKSSRLDNDRLSEQARATAAEQVDKELSQLGEFRPPSITIRAVHGIPAEELIKAAENADMLVVAARGTGGFARLHLGSVSTQLTHHARCPVVIIPPDDRDLRPSRNWRMSDRIGGGVRAPGLSGGHSGRRGPAVGHAKAWPRPRTLHAVAPGVFLCPFGCRSLMATLCWVGREPRVPAATRPGR